MPWLNLFDWIYLFDQVEIEIDTWIQVSKIRNFIRTDAIRQTDHHLTTQPAILYIYIEAWKAGHVYLSSSV